MLDSYQTQNIVRWRRQRRSVVRHFVKMQFLWEQTYFDFTAGQCLKRIAHARFLSDTTRCPMVTSKSVCPTTVSDGGSESSQGHEITIVEDWALDIEYSCLPISLCYFWLGVSPQKSVFLSQRGCPLARKQIAPPT